MLIIGMDIAQGYVWPVYIVCANISILELFVVELSLILALCGLQIASQ